MKNNYYAVIMAGGIGSRFWPVSTEENPKQFHDILDTGESLIQRTFNRINTLVSSNNIFISTNDRYKALVQQQLPKISNEQLLLEPVMRNTAPCILYAALKIYEQNKDAVLLIAPSDHWIDDEKKFIQNIETSMEACAKSDILMTLGIKPDNPNTGYGYIQFEKSASEIKKVKQFREKPNLQTAESFLASGDFLWNAGIFVWSAKSILKAFEQHLPDMMRLFNPETPVWNTPLEKEFIEKEYQNAENISIDFGILERANNVLVLPVDFGWSDLGTWGSLHKKLTKDNNDNAVVDAKAIFRNAHGNLLKTQSGKRVVIEGLDNYIVVEKDDTLLICPLSSEQHIKEITKELNEKFGKAES